MVGINSAPQSTRVAETGLDNGGSSLSVDDSGRVFVAISILKYSIYLVNIIIQYNV